MRRVVVVVLVLLGLIGCETTEDKPVCGVVKVAEGCKAQCSRLLEKEGGAPQVCVVQLISRRKSENTILKSKIKKVNTVRLSRELCFDVQDGRPKDLKITNALVKACAGE